ncbi:hypothetical protein [Cellulomonas edaphi]|uniref:Fe-S protein n=1 Tax=Cellulomonas edaphi TaxID=3053468 RepID=A0ABT7S8S6_9CELL|nr:hypothetical protein [Cellulomons edaphi]MDM7831939.1 hypothetical protein [Cellulomons edaphi]
MEDLYRVLLVLHLLGWAIVLGGVLVNLRSAKIPKGVLHGILTALITGVLMVGLAESSDAIRDPDTTKITVKLLIALVVTVLVVLGVRKPRRVTTGYLGAIAGLTAVNVAIAVLWR